MSYATTLDEVLALRSENFHLRDRLSLARKECDIMREILLNSDPESEPDVARLHREKCDEITKRIEAETELAALRASAVAEPVAWFYETWNGGEFWSKHLTDEKPAGEKWQRNIIPLYPHPAPAAPVPASVREALLAIEAAHAAMFAQCCSNPITDAWGNEVDVSKLNEAHRLAEIALASLPAPEAIDCDICRNPLQIGEDVVLRPGRGKYHRACPSAPAPEAAPTREEIADPSNVQEVVAAFEHLRKKMRGDTKGEELAAFARVDRAILALKAAPAK